MAERTTELTTFTKVLTIGVAGAVVLGGVVFGGIMLMGDRGNADLVILKADSGPIKQPPADKGGLKINSLDSPVLSLLDKPDDTEDGIEILRPPMSEPEPPPINVTDLNVTDLNVTDQAQDPSQTPETSTTDTSLQTAQTASSDTPQPLAENVDDPVTAGGTTPGTTGSTTGSSTPNNTPNTSSDNEITAAIDQMPLKRPNLPKPNIPKIVATSDTDTPTYVVQFAAFKSEARAKNTAAVLSTKHQSRLGGRELGYMRWGDYWRVVAEPMPRADANSFCSKFRSVGQECIIKLMESPNG